MDVFSNNIRRASEPVAAGRSVAVLALSFAFAFSSTAPAQQNFKRTDSRAGYTHHIQLYDAGDQLIDPADPSASPYSTRMTCKKCHNYAAIAHGYHFNAEQPNAATGRPGEPWIWTDRRTGSQIPLSHRGWPGTYNPSDLGISPFDFLVKFGTYQPGNGEEEPSDADDADPDEEAEPESADRWRLSGRLEIDCMLCHSADRSYSHSRWAKEIEKENFDWAATAASGLAKIEGEAKDLSDDFDPTSEDEEGVTTKYDTSRFDAEGHTFFDIIRKPRNESCYACHSNRQVGESTSPRWIHDEDIHLRAGLQCADCHRNGIDHHTVRGFEGEQHPTGLSIETLTCRGCHLGEEGTDEHGGRLGSPQPLHKGLPPLHLEKMSCTSCHSGPHPESAAQRVQTTMAHELGLASQTRGDQDPPGIVQPVFQDDENGVLYPHRLTWPAFWGLLNEETITPINPKDIAKTLRRPLRVRRDFREEMSKVDLTGEDRAAALGEAEAETPDEELTEQQRSKLDALIQTKRVETFREKLAKGLQAVQKKVDDEAEVAVYISGGKAYRLTAEGDTVETFEHAAAEPYAWPMGHDVRPARHSLGVKGCQECHAPDAAIFYSTFTAMGPAVDNAPVVTAMHQRMAEDTTLLTAWEKSFQGRGTFKWVGGIAIGIVGLVLFLNLMLGINGFLKVVARSSRPN